MILAPKLELHSHEESGNVWQQAWEVITDAPHAIGEIFYALLFEIILVPVAILFYKKVLKRRIVSNVRAQLSENHGYAYHDGDVNYV